MLQQGRYHHRVQHVDLEWLEEESLWLITNRKQAGKCEMYWKDKIQKSSEKTLSNN